MKKLCLWAVALLLFVGVAVSCKSPPDQTPSTTEKTNIIIFVNFADSSPYDEGKAISSVESFNTSSVGLKAFFLAESLGKCSVNSVYGGSITLDKNQSYYKKKGLVINRDGYNGTTLLGKPHIDAFYREQLLIREAVAKADIPADVNVDADGDGFVDGITFAFNADFTDWRSADQQIMWPHKSDFYPYDDVLLDGFYVPDGYFGSVEQAEESLQIPKINGIEAYSYAIVSLKSTIGEVCHEVSHVLGKPDYYSYVEGVPTDYDNIGGYDLMGASVGDIPQFSLAFVRSKLGWLEDGKEISVMDSSGSVTLSPVTDGGVQAIKIIPTNYVEKGEFFMVEVRRKQSGSFDDAINSTGVIIYSVKEEFAYINASGDYAGRDYGNMYGNGDYEIKLFLNPSAPLNYFTGKQGYNALENITYRDGSPAGVSVTGITENEDGSFSFSVEIDGERPAQFEPEIRMLGNDSILSFKWEMGSNERVYVMAIRATSESAARYALDDLPSAESVISGDGEGLDVMLKKSLPSSVRSFLPKVESECYFVVVTAGADGEVKSYSTFHVGIQGVPSVQASFADFVKASLRVGNPAFIAICCFGGLCVLVGIVAAVVVYLKRKRAK